MARAGKFSTPKLRPQVLNKYAHSADSVRATSVMKGRRSGDFGSIVASLEFDQSAQLSAKKRKATELELEAEPTFQSPFGVKRVKRHSL